MPYKIALGPWRSVFAVPSEVVDTHLKTAGAAAIKVLLCLLRNGDIFFSPEELHDRLGYSIGDIEDAIRYWVDCGLLC